MKTLDVDDILVHIGQFGFYQIRVLASFLLILFPITYQTLIMVFVAYEPPWMCAHNSTLCVQANFTGNEVFGTSTADRSLYERRCSMPRSEWRFADGARYEGPHDTIVTEFDLVCDKGFQAWLSNSMLFFGWAVGAVVLGIISDKYGRRSVMFPSITAVIVVTFVMSFAHAPWVILLCRFIVGFFEAGSFLSMFVLATELVGPQKRALSGTLVWFYFTAALMIMALQAYYVRNWRTLCLICTSPWIFVVILWKCVPESIRWLLVHGKKDKAREILQNVAKSNKREMPKNDLRVPVVLPRKGCLELFRSKRLAIMTLIQCYAWFVNGMVYYAVSMSAGDLGGSIYLNFVLTSLVEIPGNLLVVHGCNIKSHSVPPDMFGRKRTVVGYFVGGALCCVGVSFLPGGTSNIGYIAGRVALGTLGKMCITTSFNAIYVYSAELFPTVVRSIGMGLVSVVSRIGAATAPFVVQMIRINAVLPFAMMGVLTLLAAFLCWFLPETDRPTAEVFGDDGQKDDILLEDNNEDQRHVQPESSI